MLYNNTPPFYFMKDHSLNIYFNDFHFLVSSTQQVRYQNQKMPACHAPSQYKTVHMKKLY